jgi:hypothetical protein
MDRQQISWLIVRAFGLYLLIQALMLVPDLLVGLYATRAYSNLISSMGADNNNLASTARAATSMYRTLLFGPLLKFVLFSAAGIYLLRRGGFLMRLLQHAPDSSEPVGGVKQNLTEEEASGMTVNERLSASGLFQEFDDAVERRDVPELERILRQIYLPPDSIQVVIEQVLGTPRGGSGLTRSFKKR